MPDARLLMVGESPLLGPSKRPAAALGVGSTIEFQGVQDSSSVLIKVFYLPYCSKKDEMGGMISTAEINLSVVLLCYGVGPSI